MDIRELHNKAMELAALAHIQKAQGNKDEAMSLFEKSYSFEYEASMSAYNSSVGEPSVSVLLRSAASLAMSCKKLREAEKLVALALSGEPPFEIAEELRNLLENINFHRHLEVKGTELLDDEVQLSISGNGVGYGYAQTDEIVSRIVLFTNLAVRTAERLSNKSFRKSGPMAPEHKKMIENSYMTPLKAASMAFRIKFGTPNEPTLPGFSNYGAIIDDITSNIELLNDNRVDVLKERISDTAYFDNFLALTKGLAPDGDTVSQFGITSIKQGEERKTYLRENREKIAETIRVSQAERGISKNKIEKGSTQTVIGILKVANATTNTVEITTNGIKVRMKVPDGLSDIVRSYWDEKVIVEYLVKSQTVNHLINIEKSKE